jgi:hypothetical protein
MSLAIETLHAPVPEHAPLHPLKVAAAPGVAVSCTVAEASTVCWQSAVQVKAGVVAVT